MGTWRRIATRAVAFAIAASLLGCQALRVEKERGGFWRTFELGPAIEERSHFETIAEMLAASDAVVVARVESVEVSRIFHGDAPGDVLPYVGVRLAIDRVLAGNVDGPVPLEFMAGGTEEGAARLVAQLATELPADSAVVFLHAKRAAWEAGLWRVTNSTGLWAPTARAALDTPLRGEAPGPARLYAAELAGIADMGGFVALVERLANEARPD